MRQGWIDPELHAGAFRTKPSTSRVQLARLVHWGLLEPAGSRLRVAEHLEGPLRRTFVDLGWESP